MIWRQFPLVLALGIGTTACDSLPFFGKSDVADSTTAPAVETAPPATPAVTVAPPPAPATVPRATPVQQVDEPWTPVDTGTIDPGMSRDQVIAVWGVPVAERTADGREYLYFRNGCEVTCGTFDVVLFENGGVVDVIARGPGHSYTGMSSSPMGRVGTPTLPDVGTPLTIPADSTSATTR